MEKSGRRILQSILYVVNAHIFPWPAGTLQGDDVSIGLWVQLKVTKSVLPLLGFPSPALDGAR